MSIVEKLRGGLDTRRDNSSVLEQARIRLAQQKKGSLDFLKRKPDGTQVNDNRLDMAEVAVYVNDIAIKAFDWVTDVAKPFARGVQEAIEKIGVEILDDVCEDDTVQTNGSRLQDVESGIEFLLAYDYKQDAEVVEDLKTLPARKMAYQKMFARISDITRLALLVDNIRCAESKEDLEDLLYNSKDKEVRVFEKHPEGDIWCFGVRYFLTEEVFGFWNEFALDKLKTVVSLRSRELATIHEKELEERQQKIANEIDVIDTDKFFFGDEEETDGKSCVLTWSFGTKKNTLHLLRDGDQIVVIDALGTPARALEEAREILGDEPFVLLRYLVDIDGEHLCLAKGDGIFDFGGFVKREIFPLARWIRTALSSVLPDRLFPGDFSRAKPEKSNGASNGYHVNVPDNEGTEHVESKHFFFRTEGGAGTITVSLPPEFVLSFDEAKDENQEVIAPERKVPLGEVVRLQIRRAINNGRSQITLVSCDNLKVAEEFRVNSILNNPFTETGRKGWAGLPDILGAILKYRYGQAVKDGEIAPRSNPNGGNKK